MSRDTWAYDFANPVELNRYVYAMGNPVRWADPSGYSALQDRVHVHNIIYRTDRAFWTANMAGKAAKGAATKWSPGWVYRVLATAIAGTLAAILERILFPMQPGIEDSSAPVPTAPPAPGSPLVPGDDALPGGDALPGPVKPPQKDEKDDDCPTTSHPIVWPIPIWIGLGFGDSGSTSGQNDYPKTKILKRVQPSQRDMSVVGRYVANNIDQLRPYIQSDTKIKGKTAWERGNIHHKIPLFLGGTDTEDNLVYLPRDKHLIWHNTLNVQGKFGMMTQDPVGTEYCVVSP